MKSILRIFSFNSDQSPIQMNCDVFDIRSLGLFVFLLMGTQQPKSNLGSYKFFPLEIHVSEKLRISALLFLFIFLLIVFLFSYHHLTIGVGGRGCLGNTLNSFFLPLTHTKTVLKTHT